MRRLALALLMLPNLAAAQSAPNWGQDYIPGVQEWRNTWASKQDVGGAVDANTVIPLGAPGRLSLSAALASTMDARAWGVKCDGATNDAPVIATMVNSIAPGKPARVQLPPGVCVIASLATLTGPALIEGHGGGPEGTPGTNGTWLRVTRPDAGFVLTGPAIRGAAVRNLGVMQDHPPPAPGWVPTPYDYVFRVVDTYGAVTFDNIMFAGVNKGIFASNAGRLHIGTVFGQFYTTGLEMDALYDVNRIDHLHCWPFASTAAPVLDWQRDHADCVISRRVDGLAVGDLFTFGTRSGITLASGAAGPTSAFQVSNLYADLVRYGALVTGDTTSGQFSNIVTTHLDFTSGAAQARIAGSAGIRVEAAGTVLGVNQLRTDNVESNAVQVLGSNNRLNLDQGSILGWNSKNDSSPAVLAGDGGTGGTNVVQLGMPLILRGGAGPSVSATGNSVVTRSMVMNEAGNPVNEPRGFSAPSGVGVSVTATGADPSIEMVLAGKGPAGGVRINQGSAPLMRLDNPGFAGNVSLLVRSLASNLLLTPETGEPNGSITLLPKGLGSIVLPQGVCLTADCSMRVRASTDGSKMVFTTGGVDKGSLDVFGTLRISGTLIQNSPP